MDTNAECGESDHAAAFSSNAADQEFGARNVAEEISWVGNFRVATPAEIRKNLLKHGDVSQYVPDEREAFNKLALRMLLSTKQRTELLSHFDSFVASCRVCGDVPCEHFPEGSSISDDFLLEVPILFERRPDGSEVVRESLVLVPGALLVREWLKREEIVESLVSQPLPRDGTVHSGNSSFCSGLYFNELVRSVNATEAEQLLVLSFYSDGTTVVTLGTRSLHAASVCILNSTLSAAETMRPLFFIPKLSKRSYDLSPQPLAKLRLLLFNACWEAAAQSFGVQRDSDRGFLVTVGNSLRNVIPMVGLFQADSKDQDKVLNHRGGATEVLCARCGATAAQNLFESFALRIDDQQRVDGLLGRIAGRDAAARVELASLSQCQSWRFAENLRAFDASLNCPCCSLHVARLNWTQLLLDAIGQLIAKHQEKEGFVRKRGKQSEEARRNDLISSVNAQFRRVFPQSTSYTLFDDKGRAAIGIQTGDVLTAVVERLPFVLIGVLPDDLQLAVDASIKWRKTLGLWFTRGKTVAQIEVILFCFCFFFSSFTLSQDFGECIKDMQMTLKSLFEMAELRSPGLRPSYHALEHAAVDQLLFGDDVVFTTQAFEKSHSEFAKFTFRSESNRSMSNASLSKQMFSALWNRSFALRIVVTKDRDGSRRQLQPGLVGLIKCRLEEMFDAVKNSDENVKFESSKFSSAVQRLVDNAGRVNLSTALGGIRPDVAAMKARRGTGFRLESNGMIIRPVGHQNSAVIKNCIVKLRDGSFSMVFAVGELCDAILANHVLLYCKKLSVALSTTGSIFPGSDFVMLKDTDSDDASAQFLADVKDVESVWTACLAVSDENRFQEVFILPYEGDLEEK